MSRFALFLSVLGAALIAPSMAHNKSVSFSQWVWSGQQIRVSYTIGLRDTTLLPEVETAATIDEALAAHLNDALRLSQAGQACQLSRPFTRAPASQDYVKMRGGFTCPSDTSPIRIANHGFFNLAISHVHFARFRAANAEDENDPNGQEVLFTATQRQHIMHRDAGGGVRGQTALGDVVGNYFGLGVRHILSGIDHLAFVLCLMLLAPTRRASVVLITGFTLGHSLTLALAALEVVAPNGRFIEAMIGGSIALVAAESVLARTGAMPRAGGLAALALLVLGAVSWLSNGAIPLFGWLGIALFCLCYGRAVKSTADAHQLAPLMTFTFGLFHGFGFAGLLTSVGLPTGQVISGLIGFNLGVEFGQILFIVPIIFFGPWVGGRMPKLPLNGRDILASGLTGYGVFLFVQRALL